MKVMYADDLAIIAKSKQELQEVLEEWKGVFEKQGLRMNVEKTEIMWVGHQREEEEEMFLFDPSYISHNTYVSMLNYNFK